eukprot:CAMPEP_0115420260 /NCGR_PEP_ID=MMETSP0271-20121206/25625_1 /TAXON_ID=71861 /ORGANISM="Scrippsiella trochoidea, Strain CCMP3099" /LENGTH=116 /DNA_ID=CAMNT_0002844827 /DNA_START=63 /DNA_END=410 /DNA_ORIENTATION=+
MAFPKNLIALRLVAAVALIVVLAVALGSEVAMQLPQQSEREALAAAEALRDDDQCQGGDALCAFSALQLRGAAVLSDGHAQSQGQSASLSQSEAEVEVEGVVGESMSIRRRRTSQT